MGITKKQKEVYDFIQDYYHKNGYAPTQKEIRDHFGLKSFGSVQRYLKYLIEAGYLESDWNARRGIVPIRPEGDPPNNLYETEIPLLGNVAAGNPIEAIENPDQTIAVPSNMVAKRGKYFALKVQGDSMINDGIFEDDVIICRQQADANQGQTVVALVEGEATVKNYFRKNGAVELHPANDRLSPIVVSGGEFQLAGVLVGLVRAYE